MKKFWRKKMFSLKSMTKLEDLTVFAYSRHFIFMKIHYACTFYTIYLGGILARKGCERPRWQHKYER
jgi:hypothetical protein